MDDKERLPFPPPHPGEILREQVLPALGMHVKELAAHLGVSRQSLSGLINEKRAVSLDIAQRLGSALGNGARFWLALQMQWEIWQAEQNPQVQIEPLNWKVKAA
jgi:addiction module HigA family antidote